MKPFEIRICTNLLEKLLLGFSAGIIADKLNTNDYKILVSYLLFSFSP